MKFNRYLTLLASAMLLFACSDATSGTPSTDKVKADLIGQKTSCWNFDSISEFRKLKIVDQITSSEILEYDLDIEVEGDNGSDRIMTARLIYKKQGGGWVLTSFNAKDCASTEEIAERKRLDEDALARYTDHGDGTITDKQTGLMWKKCVGGLSGNRCQVGKVKNMGLQDAINYGEQAVFADHNDWRLPSKDELMSLVDMRFKPTIHPSPFPNTPPWNIWSTSPSSNYPGSEWYIYFGNGTPSAHYRYGGISARLVRSRQ